MAVALTASVVTGVAVADAAETGCDRSMSAGVMLVDAIDTAICFLFVA